MSIFERTRKNRYKTSTLTYCFAYVYDAIQFLFNVVIALNYNTVLSCKLFFQVPQET